MEIGKHSYGPLLQQEQYIESIGAFCSFAPGSKALFNHKLDSVTTHEFLYDSYHCPELSGVQKFSFSEINKKVVIGNDVWIGENVLICNGAKIGNGVIGGAGCVITHDIPDYAIVVGNPARIVRFRFEKWQIELLNKIKWWDWSDDIIKKRYEDFLNINVFLRKYG